MAAHEFDDHSWVEFAETTANRGPLEFFHSAMEFVDGHRGAGRQAVDLGSGGGADTRNLLARGWRVTAVDAEPASGRLLEAHTPLQHRDRLEIIISPFHTAKLPSADLVYAQFSLPFAGGDFEASVRTALAAVVPGGAFVGQFFGANDDWAPDPNVAWVDRTWIEQAFDGFSALEIDERDHEREHGASGASKRWHFYHVRARR